MEVLVTGATGFVGRALIERLGQAGHGVHAWVRDPKGAGELLGSDPHLVDASAGLPGLTNAVGAADAVINLAGENIAKGRWTARRKRALESSRIETTRLLVDAIAAVPRRPLALISASAVGFYGDRGERPLDESAVGGDDFLAGLCRRWETEALRATALGLRVAILRIGVVLGRGGGALGAMLPPFRMGVGGALGSGRQYVSWIHLDDLVQIIVDAVPGQAFTGTINAVAPTPVTNAELTAALGAALHRPTLMRVPASLLRLGMGGAADLLLSSQRVVPRRLERLGFQFAYPTLHDALAHVLGPAAAT